MCSAFASALPRWPNNGQGLNRAIDTKAQTVTVKQGLSQHEELNDPKSRAGRRPLKLGTLAARFVKPAAVAATSFVWPDATYSMLQHRLVECGERAGIDFKGFGWHTLRRTYATFREMIGAAQVPSPELVRDMGHSNAAMTAHYVKRDQDVVAKLQELVYFCESSVQVKKPN